MRNDYKYILPNWKFIRASAYEILQKMTSRAMYPRKKTKISFFFAYFFNSNWHAIFSQFEYMPHNCHQTSWLRIRNKHGIYII